MELLYLSSCVITLLVLLLLAGKKGKQPQDGWLLCWFGVIFINLCGFYIAQQAPFHPFLELSSAAVFLHGPLMWGYFKKLVQRTAQRKPLLWPHFLPFTLNFLFVLPALVEGRLAQIGDTARNLLMVAKIISLLSYTLITLVHLHLFQRFLPEYFSAIENQKLRWLRLILYGMLSVWLVGAANQVAFRLGWGLIADNEDLLLNVAVSIMVLVLGYFGFRQGRVFLDQEPASGTSADTQVAPPVQHTSTDVQRLREHMNRERPYLNPELTLPQLAAMLNMSPNALSALLNKEVGLNFFDFVNGYRVEAVKQLLAAGAHHQQTLLGVALDAGFNSKASFNRVFKKTTGQTPSEYLSSLQAPVHEQH